jgi:hypothetical protein
MDCKDLIVRLQDCLVVFVSRYCNSAEQLTLGKKEERERERVTVVQPRRK